MKKLIASTLLFASLLTSCGTQVAQQKPVETVSKNKSFYCNTSNGNNITTVSLEDGSERNFIKWEYKGFDGYTPRTRCNQISARLQNHLGAGISKYLTYGEMNKENVICIADRKGEGCVEDGLIYTLQKGQSAQDALDKIIHMAAINFSGEALVENGCTFYIETNSLINAVANGSKINMETTCQQL